MIEVRVSAIHGRGAFSREDIPRGRVFHVAHLLVFPCEETDLVNRTQAGHYVFHVADCADDPDKSMLGLAMSAMSFVNHSRQPSASFAVDPRAQTITFTAVRTIAAGEEITIDYGDFADKLGIE